MGAGAMSVMVVAVVLDKAGDYPKGLLERKLGVFGVGLAITNDNYIAGDN